jgi:hypothetical protein
MAPRPKRPSPKQGYPIRSGENTIHLPDNVRSRRCECGDRAVHDQGSCVMCGKTIPFEVLVRATRPKTVA